MPVRGTKQPGASAVFGLVFLLYTACSPGATRCESQADCPESTSCHEWLGVCVLDDASHRDATMQDLKRQDVLSRDDGPADSTAWPERGLEDLAAMDTTQPDTSMPADVGPADRGRDGAPADAVTRDASTYDAYQLEVGAHDAEAEDHDPRSDASGLGREDGQVSDGGSRDGYYCEEDGGPCATRCGDGVRAGVEGCDDGNLKSHDGCSSACTLESRQWSDLAAGDALSGRRSYGLAFDARRGVTVLNGGDDGTCCFYDTWELGRDRWTKVEVSSSIPPGLQYHRMVYDPHRERVILFGGKDSSGALSSETWAFDGSTWTPVTTTATPPGRCGHGMAYDAARQVIVVFGGFIDGGATDETWELNDDGRWEQVTIEGDAPPQLANFAMDYDVQSAVTVVLGGWDYTHSRENSTIWSFDTATHEWSDILSGSLAMRRYLGMAYHPELNALLVYGGLTGYQDQYVRNDTLAHSGGTLAQIQTDPVPSPRRNHDLVWDARWRRVVAVAGSAEDLTPPTTTVYQYSSSCPDELCQAGVDQDGDGFSGCADPDCEGEPCDGGTCEDGGCR